MLLVRPYVYNDVLGEGDLIRVASGLLHGHQVGFEEAKSLHYGLNFSYGYYWVIYNVLPSSLFASASDVIRFMNETGYVSAGLVLLFAGMMISRLYGQVAAAVTVIVLGFSPMFLELSTSGHALLPGAALFFAAGWVLLVAESVVEQARRIGLFVLAGALVFGSLATRGETALALPFLICAFRDLELSRAAFKKALVRAVPVTLAFLLFMYFRGVSSSGEAPGTMNSLGGFLAHFYIPKNVVKGTVGMVIGVGMVSCVLFGLAFVVYTRRYRWAALLALLLIVPNLLFWLPNGFPIRHFFFTLAGGAIFIGVVLQSMFASSAIKPIAIAALIAVANQLAAEAAYPLIVKKYTWNYEAQGARRTTFQVPLGMFHLNHNAGQAYYSVLREEGKALSKLQDKNVVIFGDHLEYILLGLIDTPVRAQVKTGQDGATYEVIRGDQRFTLIEKYHSWPQEIAPKYLAKRDISTLRVYVQPSTKSRYDKTELPNQITLAPEPAQQVR